MTQIDLKGKNIFYINEGMMDTSPKIKGFLFPRKIIYPDKFLLNIKMSIGY